MALKMDMTSAGIEVPDAYHRVRNVEIVGKDEIIFGVDSLTSPDAPSAFRQISARCHYDMEGANPFAQAYEHLKTLDEFAAAEDC